MTNQDLQILPCADGEVVFGVLGRREDDGLMLLQRLYTLLFSAHGAEYRHGVAGYDLLALLNGANMPSDDVLNALVAVCKAHAMEALDDEDRARIAAFDCVSTDGKITGTLTLADGTIIQGTIDHV